MNIGQMAAQLNQANFSQAQAAATGDITRNLQAQQSNQGANQANINSLIRRRAASARSAPRRSRTSASSSWSCRPLARSSSSRRKTRSTRT